MKRFLLQSKKLFGTALIMQIALSGILSCKKADMDPRENTPLLTEYATIDRSRHNIVTIERYNSIIFDSCRAENVILSGQVIYKIIESFDNGYFLYYEIRLQHVVGIGEITQTVYHGGGKILGTVRLNEPGTKVRAKITYRVKYVAPKGYQIFFTQNARFIVVNSVTNVEFNNIFDSCK